MPQDWTPPTTDERTALLAEAWPRTPVDELAGRKRAILDAAQERGSDLLFVYGADRVGSAVPWLTSWQVTREAALLLDARDGSAILWLQYHNHVPLATELAQGCEVRWGGPSTLDSVAEEIAARGGSERTLTTVGPLRVGTARALAGHVAEVVELDKAYTGLRLIKSPFELQMLAVGAHLSDLAALSLRDGARPGMTDHQLMDLVERAYVPFGGTTHIHYVGISSMASPDSAAPAQITRGRRFDHGDVLVTELSAALEGYPGQVLRTMTFDDGLDPLYTDLHDVANAAFDAVCAAIRPGATPAEVVGASSMIEEAGFTTVDDLVHGFGGGYLTPVLGSASRPAGPLPDMTFEEGMTVVVQPNVTTTDNRAGVQTGELVAVTATGAVSLHQAPRGPWLSIAGSR